jgi:hypothetical protein
MSNTRRSKLHVLGSEFIREVYSVIIAMCEQAREPKTC